MDKDRTLEQIDFKQFEIQNDTKLRDDLTEDLKRLYKMREQFKNNMSFYNSKFLNRKHNQDNNPLPKLDQLINDAEEMIDYYNDRISRNVEQLKKLKTKE